jgi:hypothetical protein
MTLIDCLVMLLLNTAICLSLPRVLSLLGSDSIRSLWNYNRKTSDRSTLASRPAFSESTAYSELNAIAR